ncbi:unnamed protein product [Arabis nemorensis]|uniref:Uncharacterized protein n=1 Tax=Arabis nemorensis TaxID=586526 RepID=A0A565CXE5_9BRAS|nr:unnamed protein product [Arabis nemorensis]
MSRCYPFPPPGYVRKEIEDESLIESIKGAKEEVKKDRKHKKKDKKRKDRDNEADRSKKHRHKRRRKDESGNAVKKVDDRCGLVNSEVEFLEKSCLTMELEHQTSSQNSCDSSLHSNDRPKQVQSQPLDGRHNDSGEFVCVYLLLGLFASRAHTLVTLFLQICCYEFEEISKRIRLPSKEQKDHEVMMTNKDQSHCSSLERLYASSAVGHLYSTSANEAPRDALRVCQEKRRDPNFGSSREISTKLSKEKKTISLNDVKSRETNSRQLGKEKMPSSSSCSHREAEKPSSSHQEAIGHSKLGCSKCPPSMAVQFLNLIENWDPDRVESKLTDSGDQELWLFMKFSAKRDQHRQVKNQTTSGASSSMSWPTARFLPEAEVHALPFTVPF